MAGGFHDDDVEGVKVGVKDGRGVEHLGQEDLVDTRAKGLVCKRHGGGGRDLEGF